MDGTGFQSGVPARSCSAISPNGRCSRGLSAVNMSMTSLELLQNSQGERQHIAPVGKDLTGRVVLTWTPGALVD